MNRNRNGQTRERLRQLKRNGRGLCSVSRCERPWVSSGFCAEHYERNKKAALARYYERKAGR